MSEKRRDNKNRILRSGESQRKDGRYAYKYTDTFGYMVYRYEGALNKIDRAVVLLSYPAGALGKKNTLRVFLCSDISLSDETILEYYAHRWSIELFFRSRKRYMGLNSFMVRSAKAMDRLLLVLALAHFFFSCGLGRILPFFSGLRLCRSCFGSF